MLALTILDVAKLMLPIAAVFLAGPVGRYWRRVAEALPRIEGDRIVVQYSRGFDVVIRCLAAIMAGFAVYLAAAIRNVPFTGVYLVVALVMWGFAVALGAAAVFCWVSLRVRIEMDAQGLRGRTSIGGYRAIAWAEVARIRYSCRWKSLTIADAAGRRVVAVAFMPGFHVLLDQLRLRVPAAVREPAVSLAAVDPLK